MAYIIQPFLMFSGQAEEAVRTYLKVDLRPRSLPYAPRQGEKSEAGWFPGSDDRRRIGA